MGSYVPHTAAECEEMLRTIGLETIDELYADVPPEVKLASLDLPEGLSELQVAREMESLAQKNKVYRTIFRGAGAYRHYIPAAVRAIASKEEFVTAYTPYQAEISQGILQAIFEYQTMICELTGMAVSNASVYDGAAAAAEAVAMCVERARTVALISASAHPDVLRTIKTYCCGAGTEVIVIPEKNGTTDLDALRAALSEKSACVYIAQPNYYGLLEDAESAAKLAHEAGAKLIMGVNPIAQAVLKTPAEYGADIAVGEGQPLGLPLSFGGPYLGFMACTEKLMRRLPGRIVGETVDHDGRRAFVLTLQAREQHIRREKASSNICSNEALCAFTASVYMAVMGPDGMAEAAHQCFDKAHDLAEKLCAVPGFAMKYKGAFFHEFVTTYAGDSEALMAALDRHGILGGYPLGGGDILWCATEMNTREEIDELVSLIREVCLK